METNKPLLMLNLKAELFDEAYALLDTQSRSLTSATKVAMNAVGDTHKLPKRESDFFDLMMMLLGKISDCKESIRLVQKNLSATTGAAGSEGMKDSSIVLPYANSQLSGLAERARYLNVLTVSALTETGGISREVRDENGLSPNRQARLTAYNQLSKKLKLASKGIKRAISLIEQMLKRPKKGFQTPEMYSQLRRNMSFSLDVNKIDPNLFGRVNVVIRHCPNSTSYNLIKAQAFSDLMEGGRIYGSIDNYYREIYNFVSDSFDRLIAANSALFQDIFGRQFSFTVNLNIEDTPNKNTLGFVGNIRSLALGRGSVRLDGYDPTLRAFEINIPSFEMLNLCKSKNTVRFVNTLVHEFSHLQDYKTERTAKLESKVRREGMARFAEFAYHKNVESLLRIPVIWSSMQNKSDWDRLKKSEIFPYEVGAFMCFLIYLYRLGKYTKSMANPGPLNLTEKGDFLKALTSWPEQRVMLKNPIYWEYSRIVLIFLRNIGYKAFFQLYRQYASEMGIKLKYLDEFVDEVIRNSGN